MEKLSAGKIEHLLERTSNIRNIAIIGSKNSGKSTFVKNLIWKELEEPIISAFSMQNDDVVYNFCDVTGDCGSTGEISAKLRLYDGCVLVVDFQNFQKAHVRHLLKLVISERIKPILFLNKLDVVLLEQIGQEELAYQMMSFVVQSVNGILEEHGSPFGQINPLSDTVLFGSALYSFCFTLKKFAQIYCSKFSVEPENLLGQLWGDKFLNPTTGKIRKEGPPETRSFTVRVLKPLRKVFEAVQNNEGLGELLSKIGVDQTRLENSSKKSAIASILDLWLGCKDTLFDFLKAPLPSPPEAQAYRVDVLCVNSSIEHQKAISTCNSDGTFIAQATFKFQVRNESFLVVRIFSGRIISGSDIKMIGMIRYPHFGSEMIQDTVQDVVLMTAHGTPPPILAASSGSIIAIQTERMFRFIRGTLTQDDEVHTLQTILPPQLVWKMRIMPINHQQNPKLTETLRRINSKPEVEIETDDEIFIKAETFEKIMEIVEQISQEVEITADNFSQIFRETITDCSSQKILCKSPNKHNRLWGTAEPLPEQKLYSLSKVCNWGVLSGDQRDLLHSQYGWDQVETRKIWAVGNNFNNILMDKTQGIQYLTEIKEAVINAFRWVCQEGVLCEEPLAGIQFNLTDVTIHPDTRFRGNGQIVPTARRILLGSMLCANPTILEPMYQFSFIRDVNQLPQFVQQVYQSRGYILQEEAINGTDYVSMDVEIPVSEAQALKDLFHAAGIRFEPQYVVQNFIPVPGSPFEEGSPCYELMMKIRLGKGMRLQIPDINNYIDKH